MRGKEQVLEFEADNAIAECLEPLYIKRNIVVRAKDMPGAAAIGILDIGKHPVQGKNPERPAVHFLDTAEVAQMQASPGGLDDVRPAEVHVKSLCQAFVSGRDLDSCQVFQRTWRIVVEISGFLIRQAEDFLEPVAV